METTAGKPVEAMRVACELYQKEVPASEAVVAEATDYFAYFCGLDCYEQWLHRGEAKPAEAAGARG